MRWGGLGITLLVNLLGALESLSTEMKEGGGRSTLLCLDSVTIVSHTPWIGIEKRALSTVCFWSHLSLSGPDP